MTAKGRRRAVFGAVIFGVYAVFAAVIFPANALATGEPHEFLAEFGQNCTGGGCGGGSGETKGPLGIAANPSTGHVFVADALNNRVDEFTPWGYSVKAFGWDVAPGPVNEVQEVRVRAGAGQFKLGFGPDTTADLPFDATGAEVETALDGLPSIGDVSVEAVKGNPSGATPFIYLVSFVSPAGSDVEELVATNGTVPLSGGNPSTSLEVHTRVDGSPPGTGLEACTVECQPGDPGSGPGQFNGPRGLVTDSEGNVYVLDYGNHRVEKFDSRGRFLLMLGGGVDQGPVHPGNLCTAAFIVEGDTCGAGKAGLGAGEFSEWPGPAVNLIAVGPGDVLYVGDMERVQKFNPNGTPAGTISLLGKGTVTSLAVAPSGSPSAGEVYVGFNDFEGGAPQFPNVFGLDSSGTELCEIFVGRPTALASDSDGNVYVYADQVLESPTEFSADEIREYKSDCSEVEAFAVHDFEVSFGVGVNPIGDVYAGNSSLNGANSYVRSYGPAPVFFEAPPDFPPEVTAEYAEAVGVTTATLGAQINPKFWADTTYYVQYGLADCEASACKEEPASPGQLLIDRAVKDSVIAKGIELDGLAPGTLYHYRFVAVSGGGGPVSGQDQTFRTFSLPLVKPPGDGRVYEKVSPADKNSGEVGIPDPAGGAAEFTAQPQQASPNGSLFSFASITAFADPKSGPAGSQYFSQRGGGGAWSTQNIGPLFEEGFLRDPITGFSGDLSHAAVYVIEPSLTPAAPEGFPNLYWRDNATGSLATLATRPPDLTVGKGFYCLLYGGSSVDSRRVFFAAKGALIEGDPVGNGFNLYEWSADRSPAEALRLVSVLPDETAAKPALGTGFGGAGGFQYETCIPNATLMRHAIADDGSRAFWTYNGSLGKANNPLLARVGGVETVQLDTPQGLAGAGGGGIFWDATPDGSRVFFTDAVKLVPGAAAGDLYRYDFNLEGGERLEDLTKQSGEAASVQGVIGSSEDGSYVYFAAKGVLATDPNAQGDVAQPGQSNLYVWHQGDGIRFIANLGTGKIDALNWARSWKEQTARVSADGRSLAFVSTQQLTDYRNEVVPTEAGCQQSENGLTGNPACAEVYLYRYSTLDLDCASCNPSNARPHGPATLTTWRAPYEQPRYLSADGSRLFFETLDSLDPQDRNAEQDVYEYELAGTGGCGAATSTFNPQSGFCLNLVTTGESSDGNYFLDASSNGDDAFVSSRQQLVLSDQDERYDVYDARIGGEVAAGPESPCRGEVCHGPSTASPPSANPGTATFQAPKQCPEGTRKVTREGSEACARAKTKKPDKHKKGKRHRHKKKGGDKKRAER